MSTLQQRFGMKLKLLRVARGLTQEDLAEHANVSSVFISSIERGINQPSFRNVERFAEILNVLEMELFDFTGLSEANMKNGIGIRAQRKPSPLIVRHKKRSQRKSASKE